MDKSELKARTKAFGLRVLKLVRNLPRDIPAKVGAHQLARGALSVGANYQSDCGARSRAEYLFKPGIAPEEVGESSHWLEIIAEDNTL